MLPTTIAEEDGSDTRRAMLAASATSSNSFWKYKPFLKGPKGITFDLELDQDMNGHTPLTFNDPATSDRNANSYKLSSSTYRVGEGNDITPNVAKLAKLGTDIQKVRLQILETSEKGPQGKALKRKLISRYIITYTTIYHT